MPCLKEKKALDCRNSRTTFNQKDYITKYNPEEDIEEKPEEAPEDMSRKACNFDIDRDEPLETCPECESKIESITSGMDSDPESIVERLVCTVCDWTDRNFFSEMTPEEVLDRIEEVCF